MILNITFTLTLDAKFSADTGQSWGLLRKRENQLELVNGTVMIVTTTIERLADSDFRGDAVAGNKGERFVYFGLEKNGQWLRRWKLRQHQLDDIFNGSSTSSTTVHVFLGLEVTPTVSTYP
jgi:hypothetical protein